MNEISNYYSKEMIDTKIGLTEQLLKELNSMSLAELKENYLYFLTEPLFSLKYDPYTEEIVKEIQDKESFKSYFQLGLNLFLTHLKNYDIVKLV